MHGAQDHIWGQGWGDKINLMWNGNSMLALPKAKHTQRYIWIKSDLLTTVIILCYIKYCNNKKVFVFQRYSVVTKENCKTNFLVNKESEHLNNSIWQFRVHLNE